MKNLGFVFFLLLLSVSARSYGQEVFTSSSRWNGDDVMTVLEVQGITMAATEKVLDKCRARGNRLCAFKSSDIVEHNHWRWSNSYNRYRRSTEVKVVLQAIDRLPVIEDRDYTGSDTWRFSEESTLNSLGVKGDALDSAISACEKDGNHFCVIESVLYLKNNVRYYDRQYRKYRYRTTAEARVRGYSLDQGRY